MEGEARQLVGAIVDTGCISTADAELVVEQLMVPAEDSPPPLHAATFKHVSNGPLHASTVRTSDASTHLDWLLTDDL